jgi:hypothetical protein
MDNLSNTFSVLILELLNPNQELFAQTRHVASAFTYFPALPTELRWMIWRRTFPPGIKMQLDIHYHGTITGPVPYLGSSWWNFYFQSPEVPVSLHVCKESRDETLRFYVILLQQLEFNISNKVSDFSRDVLGAEVRIRKQLPKRFCVNPAKDIITFNYWWCNNYKTAAQQYYWAEKLNTIAPVTRLALEGYFGHASDIGWERDFWDSDLQEPKLTGITSFHHLEEIWCVKVDECERWGPKTTTGRAVCRRGLIKSFMWERKRYPDCKIPAIHFMTTKEFEERLAKH